MPRNKFCSKVFSRCNFFAKNSMGQAADTATWVIATLVIIFILMISVYAASKIGRTSEISLISAAEKNREVLAQQSFQAYLLTKNANNMNFYNQISSSGKISSTDELIAATLFGKIYGIQNSEMSLKITDKKSESLGNIVAQAINIDKNNFVELIIKLKGREATI